MPLFHVDQRPARERCEELLARVPDPDSPEFFSTRAQVLWEVRQVLRGLELEPKTRTRWMARALGTALQDRDRDACRRILLRGIRPAGRVRPLRVAIAAALVTAAGLFVGSVWSIRAGATFAAAAIGAVLVSLPVGGAVARSLLELVFRGKARRMYRRWHTLGALSLGSRYASRLYARMIADAEEGLDDASSAGLFFGEAIGSLAERAAHRGHAELLRRVHADLRRLILAGRVPFLSGNGLGRALETAESAPPEAGLSPAVAKHLLRRLVVLSPDAGWVYESAERELRRAAMRREKQLQADDSLWELYAEARAEEEVAPRAEVASSATARSNPTTRERYLERLRALVTRALHDQDEEGLNALMRDIDAYIERRRDEARPAPEDDRALDAILERLAGDSSFPGVARAAREARRALAACAA